MKCTDVIGNLMWFKCVRWNKMAYRQRRSVLWVLLAQAAVFRVNWNLLLACIWTSRISAINCNSLAQTYFYKKGLSKTANRETTHNNRWLFTNPVQILSYRTTQSGWWNLFLGQVPTWGWQTVWFSQVVRLDCYSQRSAQELLVQWLYYKGATEGVMKKRGRESQVIGNGGFTNLILCCEG